VGNIKTGNLEFYVGPGSSAVRQTKGLWFRVSLGLWKMVFARGEIDSKEL
jgi:hypothetical protein